MTLYIIKITFLTPLITRKVYLLSNTPFTQTGRWLRKKYNKYIFFPSERISEMLRITQRYFALLHKTRIRNKANWFAIKVLWFCRVLGRENRGWVQGHCLNFNFILHAYGNGFFINPQSLLKTRKILYIFFLDKK